MAAAESSLHHRSGSPETWLKKGLLPDYPQLHGVYHLNRVHDLTGKVANLDKWRLRLDEFMGTLGGLKQINLFVYFVPTADQSYRHAIQAHWNGANKNDTVIIIGIPDGKTIEMVEVVTWAKSDLYRQELIDGITGFGTIEADSFEPVLHLVNDRTLKHYERRPMADFAHLEKEIKPPTWMMVILVIIAIPGSLALAYVFHVIDLDAMLRRRGGGSYRRNSGIRIRRRRF